MADTIRQQMIAALEAKLATIRKRNGFKTDLGREVFTGLLIPLDSDVIPAVGIMPGAEDTDLTGAAGKSYKNHSELKWELSIQGVCKLEANTAFEVAEWIYADVFECLFGNVAALGFDSGGGVEVNVGDTIEGNTSGASAYVAGIELTSGSWAGADAAGAFALRRCQGEFLNNEQINVGSDDDVATVDGVATWTKPIDGTLGGFAESLKYLSARPQFPDANQLSVGMQIIFAVQYKIIFGNPYSQLN